MPQSNDGDEPADPEPRSRWQLALELVEHAGSWQALGNGEELIEAVRRQLAAAPELAGRAAATATVVLSDDATVAALNIAHRGKAGATNVLSFPAPPRPPVPGGSDEASFLGDIILAEQTVAQEARELAIPFAHHVQHLVVHGLLHLVGFDHASEEEARRMESLETRLLAALGIADPYADRDDGAKELLEPPWRAERS